jgi:energy-coupling factor transport system ATP-binding protein
MTTLCGASNGGRSVLSENFAATLFITHDLDLAVTYANRVLLFGDKHIVADGAPEDVLKDTELLLKYRVRPTSLLRLNLDLIARTKRFLPAESLAEFVS